MKSHQVRIISQTINAPIAAAYDFAHRPENFPKWAAGLSKSLHKTTKGWVADTPQGEAIVRFSEPNAYGVLDHWVEMSGKAKVYIPLRMVANASCTEVELVLFRQPEMNDLDFDKDEGLVLQDLIALKKLLEASQ
ncbi:SRPBCC family protein [Aquabacterium sp.]|uniref:SRPBCC family protein n=1 Tax=Aquabacterium sp. TaxID=1872578 RepID=UPI002487375E|nr:SRPBCC family protein [Aquabacterium sp.]MDI1260134.1 SRPBCC family protein [Aquabacterium sp.]